LLLVRHCIFQIIITESDDTWTLRRSSCQELEDYFQACKIHELMRDLAEELALTRLSTLSRLHPLLSCQRFS
jgi:hypothetical protein